MAPPKKYNLDDPAEIERWFREMKGYLQTEDFLNQGTDRKGRLFAHEAFLLLPEKINKLRAVCEALVAEQKYFEEHSEQPGWMPGNEFYSKKFMAVVNMAKDAIAKAEGTP